MKPWTKIYESLIPNDPLVMDTKCIQAKNKSAYDDDSEGERRQLVSLFVHSLSFQSGHDGDNGRGVKH